MAALSSNLEYSECDSVYPKKHCWHYQRLKLDFSIGFRFGSRVDGDCFSHFFSYYLIAHVLHSVSSVINAEVTVHFGFD